ncbi:MAG: carbohydrate kinase [Prevotella sp.]
MTRKIIGLGEVLYDVLPEGAKLGGAPANFAYHASQFGFDAMAVSAVGNDALGDLALKTFDDNGLKYIIPRVPYPTGTVNISLDAGGVPSYTFTPDVAWDHIPFTPEMEAVAKEARAVCFGSLAQRSEASRKTIHQFLSATPADCLKIFDINLRGNFYNKEIIRENMQQADILKINDEELVTIGRLFDYPGLDMEEKCRLLLRRYHFKMVVLTCGTNGSYVFVPDGETSFMPTPKVEVADTVGAGDSFTAAFTASLLAGKTIKDAHERAVKVSAFVCTQKGAMPELPKELTK